MTSKPFAAKMLLLIAGVAAVLLFASLGHCTVTTKSATPERVVRTDPNVILVGTIKDGNIIEDENGNQGTNLRIQSAGHYDQSVMFCGYEGDRVTENYHVIQDDLIFTYRRAASRLVNGVPCFELISVEREIP